MKPGAEKIIYSIYGILKKAKKDDNSFYIDDDSFKSYVRILLACISGILLLNTYILFIIFDNYL